MAPALCPCEETRVQSVSSHLSTPSVHEAAGKVVTVATSQVVRMPAEVPSFLQTVHRHHEEGESV